MVAVDIGGAVGRHDDGPDLAYSCRVGGRQAAPKGTFAGVQIQLRNLCRELTRAIDVEGFAIG